MLGRQFMRKCTALSNARQMLSSQVSNQVKRKSTTGIKNSKSLLNNTRSLKSLNTTALDTNTNFLKQMEKFSILRCSAVGMSTLCQSIICATNSDGALESSEDDEEACPVKRQSLARKKQKY